MTMQLTKKVIRTFIPATLGKPGSSGQLYLPTRYVGEAYQVCGYTPLSQAELQAAYAGAGVSVSYGITGYDIDGNPFYGNVYKFPPGSSGVSIPSSQYTCHTEYRTVYAPAQPYVPPTPAIPASPSQLLYDFQLGWTGRARSIAQMNASGRFSFRVPASTVGAVVGLAKEPRSSGFSDILWGFYVARGVVRIYEQGAEAEYIGANPDAQLAIVRRDGQIEYEVNGSIVRTVANNPDPLFLTASLYSGGDSVDDAELEIFGGGEASIPFLPMQVYGGDTAYAIGTLVSAPMTVSGYKLPGGVGELTMLPMHILAADAHGYSEGEILSVPMTVEGEALALEPEYALANLSMLSMLVQSSGTTGAVGGGGLSMLPMDLLGADRPYGQAKLVMAKPTVYAENFTLPTEAVMINFMLLFNGSAGDSASYVVMNSDMTIAGIISVQSMVPASMPNGMGINVALLTQAELEAMIASIMSARNVTSEAASDLSVWSMNMDNNGGTRYENYGFNSFAKIGNTYYGANSEGLFALEGADDNGEEIAAEVNFGKLKFGTTVRKSMRYCYVGVASDGRLVLKVEADGETYYYDVRDYDELQEMQRFELGRGLRAVYYDFTLQNYGGSAFDLASIEFTPIPLTRRL